MSETTNLFLPFIASSQAQKHVTHNEALLKLDALVQLAVLSRAFSNPPADPQEGDRYLIASPAGAEWSGHDGAVAAFQDGVWNVFAPGEGWRLWLADEQKLLVFSAGAWVALDRDVTATSRLGISATADDYNRLALSAPASLFNHAGSGHQLKLNKATSVDTASLLFQTNWSGRAEMGLAGDDHFRIKVSADGSTWREALCLDRASGEVGFPSGIAPGHAQRLGQAIVASPSQDSHNFDPSGWNGVYPDKAAHIRLTPAQSIRLTGLAGGEPARLAILANAASGDADAARLVILEHRSADSSPANLFSFADSMPRFLMPGDQIALLYDAEALAWTELSPTRLSKAFDSFSDAFSPSELTLRAAGSLAGGAPGSYLIADAVEKPRGVYRLSTGTAADGRAHWGSAGDTILATEGSCLYLARLALEALSSASERFRIIAGWHDGQDAAELSSGVYWEYDDSASPLWRLCAADAGLTGKTDSSVLAATGYVYLGIFLNGGWTRADFFSSVDGRTWTFHAPLTSSLPTGSRTLAFSAGIAKTAGASERYLSVDLQAVSHCAPRGL